MILAQSDKSNLSWTLTQNGSNSNFSGPGLFLSSLIKLVKIRSQLFKKEYLSTIEQ